MQLSTTLAGAARRAEETSAHEFLAGIKSVLSQSTVSFFPRSTSVSAAGKTPDQTPRAGK